MPRARLLKPGFFTNAKLGALPPHARLLFAGLWTLADREGRLKDEPLAIKGAIFPFEDVDCDNLLRQLVKAKFIARYKKGERYIQIINFLRHQTPHIKEGASTIPAPDQHSASTGNSGTSPSGKEAEAVPIAEAEAEAGTAAAHLRALPASGESSEWDFIREAFARNIGELNDTDRSRLKGYLSKMPADWILAAINETSTADDPGMGYLLRILDRCLETQTPPSSLKKTASRR